MLDYHKQDQWPNGFGQQQSPIALTSKTALPQPQQQLQVTAPYLMTTEIDDETTVRLTGSGGLKIGAREYHCVQAHFHVPTEHRVDQAAAMELHFVHQTSLGQLCVVAVLLGAGAANPTIQAIIDAFHPGTQTTAPIEMTALMPTTGHAFHYLGSLTTPPLTEGVEWYVLPAPQLTVSAAQTDWFLHQFHEDNRALQPLAGRTVERFAF